MLRVRIATRLFNLFFKGYRIFFLTEDTGYYVNDILIDTELKEIVLQCVYRRSEE